MNDVVYNILNAVSNAFSSSPKAKGRPSADPQYDDYLKNMHELMRSYTDKFEKKPEIGVFVPVGDDDKTRRTLDSVNAQHYKNFAVYRYVNGAALDVKQGDFLLFLRAGDVLDEFCLSEYAKAVAMYPQCDALYCDEDICTDAGKRHSPTLKPNFSPETLYSTDYIGNTVMVSRRLYDAAGGLRSTAPNDMYDFVLRMAHRAVQIVHIPHPIISKHDTSDTDTTTAGGIINGDLNRENQQAYASSGIYSGSYRVRYEFPQKLSVSIIVMCDGDKDELRRCLERLEDVTIYEHYKLIVADKGAGDVALTRYLTALKNCKAANVNRFTPTTSYAVMANACAKGVNTDMLVFMRSNVEVLTPDWLESFIEYAHRDVIGAVGGKLLTPDNRIVDAGTVIGLGGWWNSVYYGEADNGHDARKNFYTNTIRDVTAFSGDCFMINNDAFTNIGRFDESITGDFAAIELMIRLARQRYKNVYTPYVKLRSFCDISRNISRHSPSDANTVRAYDVCRAMLTDGDPNYNISFDYSKTTPTVAADPKPPILINPFYIDKAGL